MLSLFPTEQLKAFLKASQRSDTGAQGFSYSFSKAMSVQPLSLSSVKSVGENPRTQAPKEITFTLSFPGKKEKKTNNAVRNIQQGP